MKLTAATGALLLAIGICIAAFWALAFHQQNELAVITPVPATHDQLLRELPFLAHATRILDIDLFASSTDDTSFNFILNLNGLICRRIYAGLLVAGLGALILSTMHTSRHSTRVALLILRVMGSVLVLGSCSLFAVSWSGHQKRNNPLENANTSVQQVFSFVENC